MIRAISKLFGSGSAKKNNNAAKPGLSARDSGHSASPDSRHTIEDNSDNGTRRQMVQMLLRDNLRRQGIPANWVECRMLVVASRSRGEGMFVRLVIRHWDERLLTYSYAFQQQLRSSIAEFESRPTDWLHGISWEFDLENSCPHPDMPERDFWKTPPAVAHKSAQPEPEPQPEAAKQKPAAAETEEDDVMKDLQSIFAIRDAHLGQESADGKHPVDFEPTQKSDPK
jgi:hypothetical protein